MSVDADDQRTTAPAGSTRWDRYTYDARWAGAHGIGRHALELSWRLPAGWTVLEPGDAATSPSSAREPLDLARRLRAMPPGSWYVSAGYNAPLCGVAGQRMVPTVHDLLHLRSRHRAGAAKIAYYRAHLFPALRRAPLVLTVSETSRDDLLAEAHLDPARVVVIGNGLSSAFAAPAPTARARPAGRPPTVVALSSAKAHKNLATVLAALSRPELQDVQVILVGSPNEVTDEHGAALAKAGRMEFATGLDDRDLATLVRHADAFLALSRLEGFDLPLIEAVASRTPVVASDIAAHREVGAGLDGIRFAPDDAPDEIAAAIAGAIADPPSPGVRAADAAAVVARYDWDVVRDRLLAALVEVDG